MRTKKNIRRQNYVPESEATGRTDHVFRLTTNPERHHGASNYLDRPADLIVSCKLRVSSVWWRCDVDTALMNLYSDN